MSRADSPLFDRMIFAFGARRSGTYWLQRVLAAHPQISAVPSETHLFSHGIKPLLERFHHGPRSSYTVGRLHVERDLLLDATRDFCDRVLAGHLEPGARYLSERTPMHVDAVDVIADVYPDARLLHIIRDGRDVARSLVAREWGPDTVADAATEWRAAVLGARAAAPDDPGRYREVRYEALLERTGQTISELFEWLGLDADDAVMQTALAEAQLSRNHDAHDPRIAAGKWRDHFSAEDVAAFDAVAGDLLSELGYESAALRSPAPDPTPEFVATVPQRRRRLFGGRRASPPESPVAPGATFGGTLAEVGRLVDQILESLHTGRFEQVHSLVPAEATVRIVRGDSVETGSGPGVLAAAASADTAWRSTQVRADVHPGLPSYGVVLAYRLPDGRRAERVITVLVTGGEMRSLTLYASD